MSVLTCMPAHGVGPLGYAWPMLVGHVVATLGTAWLLARAEAWCWRLRRPHRARASRGPPLSFA